MADENPTTATVTAPAATTDQPVTQPVPIVTPPPKVTFTAEQQEALDRIIKDRLAQQERTLRPTPAAKPATEPKPAATPSAALTDQDVRQMMARQRAFDRSTATAGLSDRQMTRMEQAMSSANPDDVSTWCAEYLEDMGLKKQPAMNPPVPAPPTTATTAPSAPTLPATAPSAPQGHGLPTQDGIVDIFSMTEDQRQQLTPVGVRKALEALVSVGNQRAGMPQRPKPPSQR